MINKESNLHKVLKGASSQTIVTVAQGVVEIVSFSIMSRLLTESDFGYYAAMVAVAVVFSALSETGIGSAVVQRKQLDDSYINNAFTLSFIAGISISILLCLFSGVLARSVADETMQVPLMIYSSVILLASITSIDFSLLQRQLKFLNIGLIRITSQIVSILFAIVLAINGYGYYAILAKVVISAIITTVLARIIVKRKYHFALSKQLIGQIFNFSGWLMLSSLFRRVSDQMDRLLMTSLFSINTLGLYSRPKDFITEISEKCGSIYDDVLFPILSGVQDENDKIKNAYIKSLYYLNLLALIVMLLLLYNSELIIRIFFGEKWMHINTLFIILSFTIIGFFNGRTSDIYLRSLALTKQQFFFRIAQFVTTTSFIVVGSKLGINGVAVGFIIAYILIVLAKMVLISKQINYSFGKTVSVVLSAFQLLLIMAPIYVILQLLIPNVLWGNVIKCMVFVIVIGLCFLVFPQTVGRYYKENSYDNLMSFFRNKFGF